MENLKASLNFDVFGSVIKLIFIRMYFFDLITAYFETLFVIPVFKEVIKYDLRNNILQCPPLSR